MAKAAVPVVAREAAVAVGEAAEAAVVRVVGLQVVVAVDVGKARKAVAGVERVPSKAR